MTASFSVPLIFFIQLYSSSVSGSLRKFSSGAQTTIIRKLSLPRFNSTFIVQLVTKLQFRNLYAISCFVVLSLFDQYEMLYQCLIAINILSWHIRCERSVPRDSRLASRACVLRRPSLTIGPPRILLCHSCQLTDELKEKRRSKCYEAGWLMPPQAFNGQQIPSPSQVVRSVSLPQL